MRSGVLLGGALLLFSGTPAWGWTFREHEEIGSLAYAEACRLLDEHYAEDAPPALEGRLRAACQDVDVNAVLYGKANGTAGDRIAVPDEFLSPIGGSRATSRVNYIRLKTVNSTHFHPKAPVEWRTYHQQALKKAVAAAGLVGLDQIEALEDALFVNAFGDHFLQDAFCAGHMGFNRPGSSAAATIVFHNTWNERGRTVRNRDGVSWRTYGDEHLGDRENAEGRRQVIAATTKSVYDVLQTFIEGKRSAEHEVAIWRSLPFTIEAPEVRTPVESLLAVLARRSQPRGLEPLAAINQPATKDVSVEAWGLTAAPFGDGARLYGAMAGLATSVPFLTPHVYGGLGGSKAADEESMRLTVELGLRRPFTLTLDGIMSHEVTAGIAWQAGLRDLHGTLHAGYRVTLELAENLVQLQAGPAFLLGRSAVGYYVSVGLGYVITARGGGTIGSPLIH